VVNVATATSPTDPDGGDPSNEVAIVVPRPDDPDAGATPGPTPTGAPTPRPTGSPTAGPVTDRGDGGHSAGHRAPAGPGALAYTGAAGTALAAGVGALLLVLGGACWALTRRRRRAPGDPVPASAMPVGPASD
jgi:LPXTG-motif cell wall-anchored protein